MGRRVYVLVEPGRGPGSLRKVLRWAQALVPAVVFLAAPGPLPASAEDEDAVVISIDADEVAAGPLALADAIARRRSVPVEPAQRPGS